MKIKDIINALLGRKKLLQLEAPKEEKKPTPANKRRKNRTYNRKSQKT